MATISLSDDVVDNLRIFQFFDPDAAFDYGTDDELSLVSRDGYQLVLEGSDFAYDRNDAPTDGTVTDVFLYDPDGSLVGRIDDVSFSLEDYYDTVAVDARPGGFTKSILAGADTITGDDADDYLEGYGGADRIAGGDGNDLLAGDGGDDSLLGGDGDDDIDGGTGDDSISGGADEDLIYGFSGNDTISGDGGHDTIYGDTGDDRISGGAGLDDIFGGAGADTIHAGADADVVDAGQQDDQVRGGSGNDDLFGNSGNDTLVGDSGADTLEGGTGDDQFLFLSSGTGADFIVDFTRGDDTLAFAASGFDNLTSRFGLVVGDDPEATSGRGTFLFDVDTHDLTYDADGRGAGGAEFVARLDDVGTLSRGDFLIV